MLKCTRRASVLVVHATQGTVRTMGKKGKDGIIKFVVVLLSRECETGDK